MTFDNSNTVQSTSSAAASFIETLGRKASNSVVSPRTDENESTFLAPSTLEGNGHTGRSQRANSIVTGASPFVSSSSLWTASTSLESLADNNAVTLESSNIGSSVSSSLWETPRRSSASALSSWKCVGSAASMLQDTTGRLQDLLNEDNLEVKSAAKPRSSSFVIEKPSFVDSIAVKTSGEQDNGAILSRNSRPTSPLDIARGHFMQLPALLHEEIGIESAEEAAEIFKRSSMDSLLDFDPTSLFSSLNAKDLKGSTLMSALSPTNTTSNGSATDFRRHSFNWLSNGTATGANSYEYQQQQQQMSSFGPSNFSVKPIAEIVSRTSSPVLSSPRGSPTLDTFPEEFIFAPTTSVAQFSKKRFARRHSIAADGVVTPLEDSFSQGLSLGNTADAAEFIPSGHFNPNVAPYGYNSIEEYQPPITGNVYAAYAGLLGEDFVPEPQNCGEMSTFLNSMRNPGMFNHQIPVSLTPAQAGINPTVLSFPNASFHLPSHKGPLYLIEFKSGRTELFFIVDLDTGLKVKIGDLVIVEADRGEDFGRITGEIPISRIRQLISQVPHDNGNNGHNAHSSHHAAHNDDVYGSNGNVNHNLAGLKETEIAALISSKEIVPKRIHRHATSLDMKFLQAKAQEEAYAMNRCQSRIRQKKLPMEVVDAEYQWDRNKLTFYFSADRRIDFRELVRDLFRIYKTRIWMCAVDKNRANLLNSLANNN